MALDFISQSLVLAVPSNFVSDPKISLWGIPLLASLFWYFSFQHNLSCLFFTVSPRSHPDKSSHVRTTRVWEPWVIYDHRVNIKWNIIPVYSWNWCYRIRLEKNNYFFFFWPTDANRTDKFSDTPSRYTRILYILFLLYDYFPNIFF